MNRIRTAIASLLIGGTLALAAATVQAQEPQKVPRLIDERMSYEWYVTQRDLWRKVIDRNSKDADAWFNYYKAVRYVGFGDTSATHEQKQARQDRVVEEVAKALPDSWIHHYLAWCAGGNTQELFPHLEQAYKLNPNDEEMARDFIVYHEMKGQTDKVRLFARKWYATGTMAPSLLDYNYNVLMSLDSNAIIITDGDNDTYPLWLLQYAKGIRTDVTVLNTSMILNSEYLSWLMKERGIRGDSSLISWDRFATKSMSECTAEFIQSLATKTERPVYIALTVDTSRISLIREDLYTVGLANRYSPRRIDNIGILKRNWKRFRLDYLGLQYYDDAYSFNRSWLPMLNMNYITPAMLLYEHDLISGDAASAADMRRLIEQIGLQGEQTEEVEQFIRSVESSQGESSVKSEGASRLEKEAKIFPNPSYDRMTVRVPAAAEADLTTLGGTIVKQLRLQAGETSVDISDIPAGTYILRISSDGTSTTRTLKVIR